MNIHEILGDEDDKELDTEDKSKASNEEEDDDVIIEGEEEEDARPAKQRASEEDDLTDEQRRELRRNRKKRQKERLRLAREHDRQMIAGLQESLAQANARLAKLETGRGEDQLAKIDTAARNAERQVEIIKAQIKKAGDEGETATIAELTDKLVEVRADLRQIQALKTAAETTAAQEREKPRKGAETEDGERGGDDDKELARERGTIVAKNVRVFTSKMPWYVMSDDDEDATEEELQDSERVRQLEKELAAEGSQPWMANHWQELEKRVREELPHRFRNKESRRKATDQEDDLDDEDNNQDTRRRSAPPRGGSSRGGGRGDGGGDTNGFRLSKERVEAMKELGIWNDPEKKKRQIAYYKKYDKENATRSN